RVRGGAGRVPVALSGGAGPRDGERIWASRRRRGGSARAVEGLRRDRAVEALGVFSMNWTKNLHKSLEPRLSMFGQLRLDSTGPGFLPRSTIPRIVPRLPRAIG